MYVVQIFLQTSQKMSMLNLSAILLLIHILWKENAMYNTVNNIYK